MLVWWIRSLWEILINPKLITSSVSLSVNCAPMTTSLGTSQRAHLFPQVEFPHFQNGSILVHVGFYSKMPRAGWFCEHLKLESHALETEKIKPTVSHSLGLLAQIYFIGSHKVPSCHVFLDLRDAMELSDCLYNIKSPILFERDSCPMT